MDKKKNENGQTKAAFKLVLKKGHPMVSSLVVAECFEKKHTDVLHSINKLEIPDDFRQLNFQPSLYVNKQNIKLPCFNITRDGFSLLAMFFTGKKAMGQTIKILEAFKSLQNKQQFPHSKWDAIISNWDISEIVQ